MAYMTDIQVDSSQLLVLCLMEMQQWVHSNHERQAGVQAFILQVVALQVWLDPLQGHDRCQLQPGSCILLFGR